MAALLALAALHPDRRFSVAELQWRLGASLESTQRAVQRGVAAGLVHPVREGRRFTYALPSGPDVMPLRSLSLRAVVLGPCLAAARQALGSRAVEESFVFGSMTRGDDTLSSDVDVLMIGDATLWDLDPYLRGIEERYDRRFDVVSVTRERFDSALAHGESFYRAATTGPRIPVFP
jgi:predicted nucleotidyltransferase